MKPKPPLKNVGASVRARLTRRASERKESVQLALTRYAMERLLYRLSVSAYSGQFVLKGAMLFSLWAPTPYRATGDLDLLGYGDAAPEWIAAVFREICGIDVEDDGVVFKQDTLRAESARAEDEYSGVRLTITAEIAGARLPVQIDIGFGDAVTPGVLEIDYPSLLDMPAPRLRAHPPQRAAHRLYAPTFSSIPMSSMSTFTSAGGETHKVLNASRNPRQTAWPVELFANLPPAGWNR